MDRNIVENVVKTALEARLSNDVQRVLSTFSDDALLRLVGSQDASEIAQSTESREELVASLELLVKTWEWAEFEILSLIIDRDRAAVRYALKTKHVPTAEIIEIETMDEMVISPDGKIVELIEFLDTATAEKLAVQAR